MAPATVPGFTHFPSHHCITGALRHIYVHHGLPLSEELLLGLGAGLGFIYWHQRGAPPMYGGRANMERPGEEGLEKTVGRRTGVAVESVTTSRARSAEAVLLTLLAAGEPVMVYVDMGYLPYFDLPEGYHFGAHAVVVAGYDRATGEVQIADRDPELHPVTLADLARARGSTYKPFPPHHRYYRFDFSGARAPRPDEVRCAIGEVAARMLRPPIQNMGVAGIRKAARETRRWPELMDVDELRNACFNGFVFIDATGGTGGGIFRAMYGRFLHEAAALTGDARLSDLGGRLGAVAELWQVVAERLRAASLHPEPASQLAEATEPLPEIADREEAIWAELAAACPVVDEAA